MNTDALQVILLVNEANALYQAGMNRQAAEIYERAAGLALRGKQIELHVHCLRWTGNSYLWSYMHDEACPHLLHAASYHAHPQAAPADIYCALTDLCLLNIRCRRIAQIQETLAQTRAFLAGRGLQHWSHRIDRLEAMLGLKIGDYSQAYELASRGWLGAQATQAGPHYQSGAYLHAMFCGAHGLGNLGEMKRILELFRSLHGETTISTTQVRSALCLGMCLVFEGVGEHNRDIIRDLARQAVQSMQSATSPFEETSDAIRLLLVAGAVDEAQAAFASRPPPNAAEAALVRLDLRLASMPEFAGWQWPYYQREFRSARPPAAVRPVSTSVTAELNTLMAAAEDAAHIEDRRLACATHRQSVALRGAWLAAVNGVIPEAAAA